MKKLALVLVIVFIFGAGLLASTPVSSAELLAVPTEATADLSNSISSTLRSLVQRVIILEKQVKDLFTKLANIQLIPGPVGPVGPQGHAGSGGTGLHLYDANNQDLGVFVQGGLPQDNDTYRSFDSQSGLIVLTVLNNNLHQASIFTHGANSIYFESNDCTGIPFTHPTGVMNVIHQKIFSGGSFHYYKEINGQNVVGVSRVAQSRQDVTGTCFPSSTSIPESLQLQEVTLPFIEPLVWPLEIRAN